MPQDSKLLITGGSGFLGWNLAQYATRSYEVFFTYHQSPISIPACQEYRLDLQDARKIEEVIEDIQPDVLIHTAALANVDLCEKHRSIAHAINVAATENLAICAEEIGCRFVYISTDLVFDGQKGNYCETDTPHPISYYGETKLLGEQAVISISTNYLIVRPALMYGIGNSVNGSFTDWIRDGFEHHKAISLFTDQYRTPLFVIDAIRALLELIGHPNKNEMYHIAGTERINRYDFGKIFAQVFGYSDKCLQPVRMQEMATLAQRGKDCSLDTQKMQAVLSFQMSDVTTGLKKMKAMTAST